MVGRTVVADDASMASPLASPLASPFRSRQRDGKLALLASLPVFAGCRTADLMELGRAVETLHAAPSALVQRQQEPTGWWTVVAEGSALATVDGIPAAMLRPGDTFGLPWPAPGAGPCGVTIMALTPMVLFTVDPRRWRSLVDLVPGLADAAVPAVGAGAPQPEEVDPRKKASNSPSTPAPCSVMPPSTTMV